MTPEEKTQAIEKQMCISIIISNLTDINNTIIRAINFDNPTCFNFQRIKLDEEAKDLLEYIQKTKQTKEETQ